jgi:hypothetical protein
MPKLSKLYTAKQIKAIRDELILQHGDKCSICKRPRSDFKNNLSVDHNHKSNRIRGLLCFQCNKFRVGRQTIESASEVLDYLLKYDLPLSDKDKK